MSRMWSPVQRFNEAFATLTLAEKDRAREAMATSASITLKVIATAGRDIVRAELCAFEHDLHSAHDLANDTYRFSDDRGDEYLIGVPPVTIEAPVEDLDQPILAGGVEYTGGGFGFSAALICLKDGEAVTRLGWNASGQFVCMMPALYLPPFNTQDTTRKVNDRTAKWIGEDQPLDCQPYFALYNAQKKWQPGWVPSTGDLLAEDWVVVHVDA